MDSRRSNASGYGRINRRASNELGASVRIQQLRALQSQLVTMIPDFKNRDEGYNEESSTCASLDISMRSAPAMPMRIRAGGGGGSDRRRPERVALLSDGDVNDCDIESVSSRVPSHMYRPRRTSPQLTASSLRDDDDEEEGEDVFNAKTPSFASEASEEGAGASDASTDSDVDGRGRVTANRRPSAGTRRCQGNDMPSFGPRHSNELAASVRIQQLRTLQNQLSEIIQDSTHALEEEDDGDDDEEHRGSIILDDDEDEDEEDEDEEDDYMGSMIIFDEEEDGGPLFSDSSVRSAPMRISSGGSGSSGLERGGSDIESAYRPRGKTPHLTPLSSPDDEDGSSITSPAARPSAMKKLSHIASLPINESLSAGSEVSETIASLVSTDLTIGAANGTESGTTRRRSRWSRRGATHSPARSVSRGRLWSRPSRKRSDASSDDGASRSSRRSRLFRLNTNFAAETNPKIPKRQLPDYDFLRGEEDEQEQGSLRPGAKWWHGVFFFSFASMLACVVTLWAPYPIGARMPSAEVALTPWSDGCKGGLASCICPRETICADDVLSMVFLTIARSTAWFDYPLYMLLYMSKANNLNNFLQKTALRCWINFSDYHRVHSLFGMIVGLESTSHSFFHILRWARRHDDIQLLWTSRTGVTGLVAIILCPFIVLPMTMPYLKQRLKFEWRKGLHYLSIVWGAALMCHAPERIFWLIGIPFFIYTADKMVEGLFKTHLLESAHFQRLGDTSCIISFENPPGFGKQNSAYVYLMLPWLSKGQFHAFTVFPSAKPNSSSVCIHKCGDWTQKLMKTITTPTHKPAFVVGPFLSPFSSPAMDSENLVAVASGIGVTPAISLIKQYSSTSRRLNLVWICRDAGLVEHFLQNVEFGSDGYTLIYYTGKDRGLILRDDLPPNVFIFDGRPNLERTIGGIISSIATGVGLPEELSNKVLTRTPAEMRSRLLLEKALSIYTMDQLFDYTLKASDYHSNGLETQATTVNYQGVLSTMKHLLGDDSEMVTDKIIENFEKINGKGDGQMDREDFEFFFNAMVEGSNNESMTNVKRGLQRMTTCRNMFESGGGPSISKWKDEFGIKKYLHSDGKFSARNWNMLYCGGSQPVLDQLKAFKRKFGIGLSVEKFDW